MFGSLLVLTLLAAPEPGAETVEPPVSAPAPAPVTIEPPAPLSLAPPVPAELPAPDAAPAELPGTAELPASVPAESAAPVPAKLPAPALVAPDGSPKRPLRTQRCLPGVMPCYRTTSARLVLGGLGAVTAGLGLGLSLIASDRNRIGDPAMPLAAAGMIAMSAAVFGGGVALLRGDGPAVPDRITPSTVSLGLALGGSSVSDESLPATLSAQFAPTWQFPHARGRLRLLAGVGGRLGTQLERDPRPQTTTDPGTFSVASTRRRMGFDLGLDLAVRLPYPIHGRERPRPAWLGQFELRYKPQVFFARDAMTLDAGVSLGEERVNQRVLLAPLNFGLRWHISPRQRFTFYMGPRWDLIAHGEPGALAKSRALLGPLHSESWFDLDLPVWMSPKAKRATVVSQLSVGYVHSRSFGHGLDFGSVVGFFGQVVSQVAFRVRPLGSPVAYQFELGARVGGGVTPFVRLGLVLPDIGGKS